MEEVDCRPTVAFLSSQPPIHPLLLAGSGETRGKDISSITVLPDQTMIDQQPIFASYTSVLRMKVMDRER